MKFLYTCSDRNCQSLKCRKEKEELEYKGQVTGVSQNRITFYIKNTNFQKITSDKV